MSHNRQAMAVGYLLFDAFRDGFLVNTQTVVSLEQSHSACRPDSIRFLGVGAASSIDLGNASAVLEVNGSPWLMIDCGFDSLGRFQRLYQRLPTAIFITHLHMDHVGGLEQVYFKAALSQQVVKLYVPRGLVPGLCRIFDHTSLAEGGHNVWDVLQIVPISERFWHKGVLLYCREVRHHTPAFSFGLHLAGCMFYSGDTRPIPELLNTHINNGELIFHDCGKQGNPSHSGIDDIIREYSTDIRQRLYAYHYQSAMDLPAFDAVNIACVQPGEHIIFKPSMLGLNSLSTA